MSEAPDMNEVVGVHDIVLVTLDTLRWDVAHEQWQRGAIPNLAAVMGPDGWERRHTPGSFTYAAHQAFFAGFLPTPARPGPHARLFAAAFQGSETTTSKTCVFEDATIVEGLRKRGYRTICAGGVGFFNGQTVLGSVLPSLFEESHWCEEFSVVDPDSTRHQLEWVAGRLEACEADRRAFVFVNVSAIHQPNRHYLPGKADDDLDTHAAALRYVDGQLPRLFEALHRRGDAFVVICSDHGTAYGEDGYRGHRLAHPSVWDVPYAQFFLRGSR